MMFTLVLLCIWGLSLHLSRFLHTRTSSSTSLALNSQDSDDQQVNEIWAILKEITMNRNKTDQQLRKTDEQLRKTDQQQRKTNQQLRDLFGYNANRDSEIEVVCRDIWCRYLSQSNWNTTTVDVTDIVSPDGTIITEWDGAVFAVNPEYNFSVLFFIEVKQMFTLRKHFTFTEI